MGGARPDHLWADHNGRVPGGHLTIWYGAVLHRLLYTHRGGDPHGHDRCRRGYVHGERPLRVLLLEPDDRRQRCPDGATFTGTFNCLGPFPASGTFFGSHCGNGILDPGEECDDGNVFDGDCCSSSCKPANPGGWCPDDGNICTDDVCDSAGNCVHPPRSGPCDDANECTAADMCANGSCTPGVPVPAGTPCGAPIDLCGTSRCDGLGACVQDPAPDGVACNDGDVCTTGDTCRGGSCVGGPSMSCGPCHTCDPQQGCIPASGRGCHGPRVRRPRKVRIDCHDGTIENQPADPLCDVDRTADGSCTFASRCPLCAFAGCLIACFEEPRFTSMLKVGEHLVFRRRAGRPKVVVIRCLPALARTTAP